MCIRDRWWSGTNAAYIGAFGGSAIGLMGAAIGCMAAMWVPKGRHKGVVLGLMGSLVALGAALALVGIAALVSSQPYHVWYPMLLCGAILTLVCGINFPIIAIRYRQAEMRRLDAESLRRS